MLNDHCLQKRLTVMLTVFFLFLFSATCNSGTKAEKADDSTAISTHTESIINANSGVIDPTIPLKSLSKIAIVIDDIGYNMTQGLKAANYPGAITLSVLPYAPNSKAIARIAHQQGKELMLHAPMSTVEPMRLDRGALTEGMTESEFLTVLRENLQRIPNITGINNHMGSALTQQTEPMQWLMTELKQYPLFFLDSRTSPNSIAWEVAQRNQIPALKRDVFLDHNPTPDAIASQYKRLLKMAHEHGRAIAIGHPNKNTMDFLYQQVDKFSMQGVELTSISNLLIKPTKPTKQSVITPNKNQTQPIDNNTPIENHKLPTTYIEDSYY